MLGRWSKIVMCLALGVYAGIVAVDNVVDCGANYAFVRHVMSMDTTFPDDVVRDRAVTSPTLWQAGYDPIIAGEAATAGLFLTAVVALWRVRAAAASTFQLAKRWVHIAATTGFLVWFFGFEVVGGEYFAMWQSAQWNGQEAAFRFYTTMLAVLVFVNQPDAETGA